MKRIFSVLPFFLVLQSVFAQTPSQDQEAAKAGAVCGLCGMGLILPFVIFFVLNIALLVWVARDAKSRGMDSAVGWMFLVMFTSVIGLIIYLFSRPAGDLVECAHCKNKRLRASAKCPHCGNA
jgi:uncharacterized membrane protein YhaH (DUF805 family)